MPRRQGRSSEPIGQAPAVEELECDIGQAVGFPDLVDLQDIGMAQRCHRFRLDLEADDLNVVGMHSAPDHLQGDEPVQPTIEGLVDDAHAPAAELAQDLVAGRPGFSTRPWNSEGTWRARQGLSRISGRSSPEKSVVWSDASGTWSDVAA